MQPKEWNGACLADGVQRDDSGTANAENPSDEFFELYKRCSIRPVFALGGVWATIRDNMAGVILAAQLRLHETCQIRSEKNEGTFLALGYTGMTLERPHGKMQVPDLLYVQAVIESQCPCQFSTHCLDTRVGCQKKMLLKRVKQS